MYLSECPRTLFVQFQFSFTFKVSNSQKKEGWIFPSQRGGISLLHTPRIMEIFHEFSRGVSLPQTSPIALTTSGFNLFGTVPVRRPTFGPAFWAECRVLPPLNARDSGAPQGYECCGPTGGTGRSSIPGHRQVLPPGPDVIC